ncbi:MAG: orotate phosphoribosyltransferase [Firmicutes bacterium]|nr:orotate phosphoribosyltransferase [Bacillota bacterium]
MDYKKDFIRFMCESGVLTFGSFTLKSGRVAPYFVNTGNYRTGRQIARLGEFYAACIEDHDLKPEVVFGPAYKGIPLCIAAASALATRYGRDVEYCFNRKEAKDHGEGGLLVGHQLKDGERVVITEDVITSGAAVRETMPILQAAARIEPAGMVISVDRMERGKSELSAVQEVYRDFGLKVYPIVTIHDIIEALRDGDVPGGEYLPQMLAYREQYGV